MMGNMLKEDVDSVREHDIASHIESQSCEETFQYCSPGPCCYADNEASIKGNQNEGKHMEASYSRPAGKIGLARKESDFYTEINVTEIELPEMIVCFTDSACHTVKDICIDDRAHSLKKVLVESDEGEKLSSRLDHSVSNGNYGLAKGMIDNTKEMMDDEPISHGLKSSSINELPSSVMSVIDDGAVQCSYGSSLEGGGELDTVTTSVAIIEEQLLPLQEDTDPSKVDYSSFNCINDQKPFTVLQKIDQGTSEGGNSTAKDVPFAAEEDIQSSGSNGIPANSEAGVVALHFDSGITTVSGSEESKGKTDEQTGEDQYIPKSEEATFDGATASARISFVHHGHGDLNFYGPASLSGPIASSGHIPYSGSISLRSDSSTTSARSFAFPILPSEWNSSPIKMAKADRRRLRKHCGWRIGLLCCRF